MLYTLTVFFIASNLEKNIILAICSSILEDLPRIFEDLNCHMVDTAVNDNHIFQLVKLVSSCYSKIRLYHLAKEHNRNNTEEKVRKKFNKLVLFKHQ